MQVPQDLADYRGMSPRPDDFDAYWERALGALEAADPAVEIVPADFDTTLFACDDVWFTGVGGARLHAKMVRPRHVTGPSAATVYYHGSTLRAPDWFYLVGFAANGHTVVALDCRGQAGESDDVGVVKGWTQGGFVTRGLADVPDKLYYRDVYLDTAQIARIVMGLPWVDGDRVGVTGGSQGGALAVAAAALEPRVRRVAIFNPGNADFRWHWRGGANPTETYGDLREWLRAYDPLHERVDAMFTRLGYIDAVHLAPRVRAESLLATAFSDRVCPPATQMAVYNGLPDPKRLVVYPDHGHESLPGLNNLLADFLGEL